jgi:tetratricopeptide (TPR) repeat protein
MDELPEEFRKALECPITREVPPVPRYAVTNKGNVYCASALAQWLRKSMTDPMTNLPMAYTDVEETTRLERQFLDWTGATPSPDVVAQERAAYAEIMYYGGRFELAARAGHSRSMLEMGYACLDRNLAEEALYWADKALELQPKNVDLLLLKARTLLFQTKLPEAHDYFQKCYNSENKRHKDFAVLQLVSIALKRGRFVKASKWMERDTGAVHLLPEKWAVWAQVFFCTRRYVECQFHAKLVLDADPTNALAQFLLAAINMAHSKTPWCGRVAAMNALAMRRFEPALSFLAHYQACSATYTPKKLDDAVQRILRDHVCRLDPFDALPL